MSINIRKEIVKKMFVRLSHYFQETQRKTYQKMHPTYCTLLFCIINIVYMYYTKNIIFNHFLSGKGKHFDVKGKTQAMTFSNPQ